MQPGTLTAGGLRRLLVVLCVSEITSYGVLFYAFAVLAPSIAADTGWSISATTAAFSAGLVAAALAGIPAGRLLDRVGPRPVMTAGSALAVPALLGVALAPSWPGFLAAWVLAGVAMAGTLYPPAFAAVTRWWGPRRVGALTVLTLLAGLASTIFAPLTAALHQQLGWRHTYLVLAVILAAVTIPAHLFGLRGDWPDAVDGPVHAGAGLHGIARSRPFVLLVAAVGLASFSGSAVVVNQVPLLLERGLSTTTAAWALGLGGLGQVLGRLGYARLAAATGVRGRGVLVLALAAGATGLLAVLPGPAALLIGAAILAGATRGIFTLLHATAVSDRWGPSQYGRLNGLLSAPAMLATALAPWAGAALADALGGFPPVFAVLAAAGALASVLAAGSVPREVPRTPDRGAVGGAAAEVK